MLKRFKKVKKIKKKPVEQPPDRDASAELELPLDETSPANFDPTAEKDTLTYDPAEGEENSSDPDDLPPELRMLSVPKFMLGARNRSATFAVLSHKKNDSTLSFRLQADIDPAWLKQQHRVREEQRLMEEKRFENEPPLKPKLYKRINYMKNNLLKKSPKTIVISTEDPETTPTAGPSEQKPNQRKSPQESNGQKSLIPTSKVQKSANSRQGTTPTVKKPAFTGKEAIANSPRSVRRPSAATFRRSISSGQQKTPKPHQIPSKPSGSGLQKQATLASQPQSVAKGPQRKASSSSNAKAVSASLQKKPCDPPSKDIKSTASSAKGSNPKLAQMIEPALKMVGSKGKLTRGIKTFELSTKPKIHK
ncbi:nucleolar and coiled-body phosphoprotein 1-like [Cloeon dipterum]|uniref:nucleolar and coiled-body phosphoprotein 1-like n=1 Tax=Cloeon dipterum TaxID=197152 RepID=UPI003220936C